MEKEELKVGRARTDASVIWDPPLLSGMVIWWRDRGRTSDVVWRRVAVIGCRSRD